jgi:hypothetical protein
MALYEDSIKGMDGPGMALATGVALLVLAPMVLPVVGRVIRPVAKSAVQSGILLYRQIGETTSELVAEARSELRRRPPTPAGLIIKPAGSGRSRHKRDNSPGRRLIISSMRCLCRIDGAVARSAAYQPWSWRRLARDRAWPAAAAVVSLTFGGVRREHKTGIGKR